MDAGLAIATEGVGKRYELGAPNSTLLSERLGQALRRRPGAQDEFWALRDVTLEIPVGQVVGVVGPNGAGKSTLLKIISRIVPPTEGRARVRGRVGTLLEVGTGFHPELSGRENVFLNGAVLGMRRREILQKYDEIVEFAGVERFLETPVKRYSSGMYVRLAFAVAAHLEPEILLVDEVLAVGDLEFQRKCLGKMRDVASHGRTVLFVSHNLGAIRRLCDRALLFQRGRVSADGDPMEVVSGYAGEVLAGESDGGSEIPDAIARIGTAEAKLRRVSIAALDGRPVTSLHLDERFQVVAEFDVLDEVDDAVVEVGISSIDGERVVTANSVDRELPVLRFAKGRQRISVELDVSLLPGDFALDVGLHHRDGTTVDYVQGVHRFTGLNAAERGDDHYPWGSVRGQVRPRASWSEVSPPDGSRAS